MPKSQAEAHADAPGAARRIIALAAAAAGTIVWTHSLAALLRAAAGIPASDVGPASVALTLAAALVALVGTLGHPSRRRAAAASLLSGFGAAGAVGILHPSAFVPALALAPAGAALAVFGAWLARRLPASLDGAAARRPWTAIAWAALALVALVQVGRLATYVTDRESDWFLTTRHPFYAKHECAPAYVYAAELNERDEPNVYDAAHYPGLSRDAAPHTEMEGMTPEDPFQYAPQFLLWPRLAVLATHDYDAIRAVWFGLNVTLCLAAVGLLAAWVGGRVGLVAGLLLPAILASFPVLHDFQYGQFHFAAVALTILALLAFHRRHRALGGALLAVSILSKLFPAVVLVPLAAQRRWRELAWTAGAGTALSAVALLVLGPAPFAAFLQYHLPRLGDGSAFAFGTAWPEVAPLLVAANQGVQGMLHKLWAMGVGGEDASLARAASVSYAGLLLALGAATGLRLRRAGRAERAIAWLGLLGMGSLASAGAWADYVPLTCVWLLALLAPQAAGRPAVGTALAICAVFQALLLGTMPIGDRFDAGWMIPLSLLGSAAMLATFVAPVARMALGTLPRALTRPAHAESEA